MKKIAFTLAEVLITLSILGVVAAISIPNIIQNYKEKQTVVKLRKIYSQLNQAFDIEVAVNGPINTWDSFLCSIEDVRDHKKNCTKADYSYNSLSNNGRFLRIINNFSQQKKCSTNLSHPNKANDDCYINDNESNTNVFYSYTTDRYLLKDGIFIYYDPNGSGEEFTYEGLSTKILGKVYIDINGNKNPNQSGRDLFMLWFTESGFIPFGGSSSQKAGTYNSYYSHNNLCGKKNSKSSACTRWVIERGNMDYLRKDTKW